jgi:hypothetical protein
MEGESPGSSVDKYSWGHHRAPRASSNSVGLFTNSLHQAASLYRALAHSQCVGFKLGVCSAQQSLILYCCCFCYCCIVHHMYACFTLNPAVRCIDSIVAALYIALCLSIVCLNYFTPCTHARCASHTARVKHRVATCAPPVQHERPEMGCLQPQSFITVRETETFLDADEDRGMMAELFSLPL